MLGAPGQERAGVGGQRLGAQLREQPRDRLRVRRGQDPQGIAPAPQRAQDAAISRADPGGDVVEAGVSAQHRRGAHRQDTGRRVPDPAARPRIGNRGETPQQITAAGGVQPGRVRDQLRQHRLRLRLRLRLRRWHRGGGHAKLGRQRSLLGLVIFDNPGPSGAPLPLTPPTRTYSET